MRPWTTTVSIREGTTIAWSIPASPVEDVMRTVGDGLLIAERLTSTVICA